MESSMSNMHSAESKSFNYGWVVVGMAFLANLMTFGLVYAFGAFLKPLSSEFEWSRSVTAGAFSFYAIFHQAVALLTGRLVDRVGPRLILGVAGFCLGLSMVLMRYVSSIGQLYLFFGIIFSIGVSATFVPSTATVSRWFSARRGFALGLTAAGLGAGSLVFSPLSAWLISSYGWRAAYIIVGITSWVIFIPIVKFTREAPYKRAVPVGKSDSSYGLTLSEALRTRTLWVYGFTWLFIDIGVWSVMIHIIPLATDRGMPLVTAGFLAGLIGATSVTARICAGFLSDKVGRKRILITGFIIQLMAFVWLLFSEGLWMLFTFAVIFGLGSGGWAGVMVAFTADYFGLRATGSILGFLVIMGGIGMAIGPYLGGYIFDVTHSYNYMILGCLVATASAIILATFLRPIKEIE